MDSRTDPPDPTALGDLATSGAPVSSTRGPSERTRAEFSDFYRSFLPALVSFLIVQGARQSDAVEVAQETMALALDRWDRIDHPWSWARKVASRRYARRIGTAAEYPVAELPDWHSPLVRNESDLDAVIERSEVLRILAALPPRQRQVMAWVYDGYAPIEIAEQLRMTPEAVRVALHKARRTLREAVNLRRRTKDAP